jgi:hypothetical protein
MSDSLPMGRRKQATTSENADAGHVDESGGISNASTTVGTSTLNPETKYSYVKISEIVRKRQKRHYTHHQYLSHAY